MRCGCVLFDEARPESGWASIEGDIPFRVNGVGDLRSDVLWWTSLEYSAFYQAGLSRTNNLRNAEFLRSSMSMLREELGLTSRFLPADKAVMALSEVFSRVMNLAEQNYGLTQSSNQKFSEDLRALLIPADQPVSDVVDTACHLAFQTFTKCAKNPSRTRTRSLLFKRNRYLHATDVMATPIPGAQFEYIEKSKLPPKERRVDWVIEQGRPAIVECAITRVDQDFANVIAFDARRWLSHPEIVALSQFARIDISSVILFNEYQRIETRHEAPQVEPGLGMLSVSIGLLAENFWVGLASPQYMKHNPANKLHSPRATWMRASDRAHTMLRAMRVHQKGVQVSSYSVGSVTIDVPNGNLQDVIDIAAAADLFPPMSVPEDAFIQGELA